MLCSWPSWACLPNFSVKWQERMRLEFEEVKVTWGEQSFCRVSLSCINVFFSWYSESTMSNSLFLPCWSGPPIISVGWILPPFLSFHFPPPPRGRSTGRGTAVPHSDSAVSQNKDGTVFVSLVAAPVSLQANTSSVRLCTPPLWGKRPPQS